MLYNQLMKSIFNIFFKIISLFILVSSCTKSTDKFNLYTAEMNDITWSSSSISAAKSHTIITALSKSVYSYNFNGSKSSAATFNNDLQLLMPANSYLVNGSNYIGNITARLIQIKNKGDFIRNLISNCNGDTLYDTKSAFLLQLNDTSNTKVVLTNNSSYQLELIDSPAVQDYQYIDANVISPSDGNLNWAVADAVNTGTVQTTSILFNNKMKTAYEVNSKKTRWINIARPVNFSNKVNNCNIVLTTNNFTNKNTIVFAVLNDYNTVIKLQPDAARKTFTANFLPLGSKVKLVSISYIDNQFYLGNQDILVSTSLLYTIAPSSTPISLISLNVFLDGL